MRVDVLIVAACGEIAAVVAGEVVAELGGRKVTLKELDEKWQALDPGEQARVTQLLYQNRRNALDQLCLLYTSPSPRDS